LRQALKVDFPEILNVRLDKFAIGSAQCDLLTLARVALTIWSEYVA
jgi:hypothetical protein